MEKNILIIEDLDVHYFTPQGNVVAVNQLNLTVRQSEILGLVGESGCGKTTTAMAILQMVQSPGSIVGGKILLNDKNLVGMDEKKLKEIRWNELALIPQAAMNSLNPVIKIKKQMIDAIIDHEEVDDPKDLKERILSVFHDVDLPDRVYEMYPHELSGGMKQRVCIAMSILLNPSLIIADEPTSALDVVVQRMVADTLLKIKEKLNISVIIISHDMGLLTQMTNRIGVMYAGNLVEVGPVRSIIKNPYHPYTQLLIESIPRINRLKPPVIAEGLTHDLRNSPKGCIFQLRCPYQAECTVKSEKNIMMEVEDDHFTLCRGRGSVSLLNIRDVTKTFSNGVLIKKESITALDGFNYELKRRFCQNCHNRW